MLELELELGKPQAASGPRLASGVPPFQVGICQGGGGPGPFSPSYNDKDLDSRLYRHLGYDSEERGKLEA